MKGAKQVNKNLSRLDREQMTFQIMVHTRYSEEALEKLPDDRLVELYKVKVEGQ